MDGIDRYNFKSALEAICLHYFRDVELPSNFKLHYHDLRNKIFPYSSLPNQERWAVANQIFSAIKSIDCSLISVTLDLYSHCYYYSKPVSPRAYTLRLLLERFQYFLEDNNERGDASYERYNSQLRKKVELAQKHLLANDNFPKPTTLSNLSKRVKSGESVEGTSSTICRFFRIYSLD